MATPRYAFASDNMAPTHPRMMQAMLEANTNYQLAYDADEFGHTARAAFAKLLGPEAAVFFVATGGGANLSGLLSVLQSFQSILCTTNAHINTDECGALERASGCKIVSVPDIAGKLSFDGLDRYLYHQGNPHRTQVRVLSLTQATEFGTIYSLTELKALCDWAHCNNLLVHLDGARLSNAIATLGCDLRTATLDAGVDIISFGGAKNGLALGEAVIFKNQKLAKNFPFARKQASQLLSKMRYVSSQFIPYIKEGLWLSNAQHANKCAAQIVAGLAKLGITPLYPVQANEIFIQIKRDQLKRIHEKFLLYGWQEVGMNEVIVRIVATWCSTQEEISGLLEHIATSL
jgi:threonine aldolase